LEGRFERVARKDSAKESSLMFAVSGYIAYRRIIGNNLRKIQRLTKQRGVSYSIIVGESLVPLMKLHGTAASPMRHQR
jgi:hypothetical protein